MDLDPELPTWLLVSSFRLPLPGRLLDHDHPSDSGFPDSSFPDSVKIYKNHFHYFWSRGPRGPQGKPKKQKKEVFFVGQNFLVMSKMFGHFNSLISMI